MMHTHRPPHEDATPLTPGFTVSDDPPSTNPPSTPAWTPGPVVETEQWVKLIHEDMVVGFKREVGDVTLYSSDGYGWSGSQIAHDRGVPDTRLRDVRRGRVFHGDVVVMQLSPSKTKTSQAVVLVHPQHGTLMWQPKTRAITALDDAWPPPTRPTQLQVIGRLEDRTDLAVHADALLAAYVPATASAAGRPAMLALSGLAGLFCLAGFEASLSGSVGPLGAWLGALIGACFFFATTTRGAGKAMTRRGMLQTALGGAWRAGVCCAGLSLIGLNAGWLPEEQGGSVVLAMSLLGLMTTGTANIVAGDLVAWRSGGYGGEMKPGP